VSKTMPEKLTAHIHLAIDEDGNWIARGSGNATDFDRREDALPLGEVVNNGLNAIGSDDRAVEWVEVVVDVPIPVAKVLEGRLF